MKLIIDISEEAKKHIDTFKGKFLCGDGCDMISAIQNGTPLDNVLNKIRAEIFNACSDSYHMPIYELSCEKIFEIIDKYNAESEDKE